VLPLDKIESLAARYEEIEALLCLPEVVSDSDKLRELTTERADLQELVQTFGRFREVKEQRAGAEEMLADPELAELAEAELAALDTETEELEAKLKLLLLPKDPNDERDTILEIRAAAGGEEAALFAADLFRMYCRYAESQGWTLEIMSMSQASAGGIKEVIAAVKGDQVYSRLRFEGGVHRVQRVPATESQGRIHTSTASVAVLPEATEVEVAIDEKDLKITKTSAGGAGGQHVNRTYSAINLTHIPTGIQIRSEEQRSQHQNLARAMQILRAKLMDMARAEQDQAIGDERRSMVGTGDRAEKIRTYNYPQNRVTDHRIQLNLHKLESIMEGDIDELVGALRAHHQAALLEEQSKEAF